MSMNLSSNTIRTTVSSPSYAVSNTFICKHMIISGYKQVILLAPVFSVIEEYATFIILRTFLFWCCQSNTRILAL